MKSKKKQNKSATPYLVTSLLWLAITAVFIIALVLSVTVINDRGVQYDELDYTGYTFSHFTEETLDDGRNTIFLYVEHEEFPLIINPDQIEYLDITELDMIAHDSNMIEVYTKQVDDIGIVVYGLENGSNVILSVDDYILASPLKIACITASIILSVISAGVFILYITKFLNKRDRLRAKK